MIDYKSVQAYGWATLNTNDRLMQFGHPTIFTLVKSIVGNNVVWFYLTKTKLKVLLIYRFIFSN